MPLPRPESTPPEMKIYLSGMFYIIKKASRLSIRIEMIRIIINHIYILFFPFSSKYFLPWPMFVLMGMFF